MENSAVEQWSGNVEKHSRWKKTKRKPDETKEGEMKCDKMKGVSFVVGTNNFKVETIKDHEMSIGHGGCMPTKRAKTAGSLSDRTSDIMTLMMKAVMTFNVSRSHSQFTQT